MDPTTKGTVLQPPSGVRCMTTGHGIPPAARGNARTSEGLRLLTGLHFPATQVSRCALPAGHRPTTEKCLSKDDHPANGASGTTTTPLALVSLLIRVHASRSADPTVVNDGCSHMLHTRSSSCEAGFSPPLAMRASPAECCAFSTGIACASLRSLPTNSVNGPKRCSSALNTSSRTLARGSSIGLPREL